MICNLCKEERPDLRSATSDGDLICSPRCYLLFKTEIYREFGTPVPPEPYARFKVEASNLFGVALW